MHSVKLNRILNSHTGTRERERTRLVGDGGGGDVVGHEHSNPRHQGEKTHTHACGLSRVTGKQCDEHSLPQPTESR